MLSLCNSLAAVLAFVDAATFSLCASLKESNEPFSLTAASTFVITLFSSSVTNVVVSPV